MLTMPIDFKGDASRYGDAEKGTLDTLPYPGSPPVLSKESTAVSIVVSPSKSLDLKQGLPSKEGVKRPAGKPKKKVSKWVLWTLWFNTYR